MKRIIFSCLCFFITNSVYSYAGIGHKVYKAPQPSHCPSLKELENRANIVLNSTKVGLTNRQLVLAFRFIETKMREGVDTYTVHETRVPCVIERSHVLNGVLIRSIPYRNAYIGRGCHKTVSKVILYSDHPKVLAECSGVDLCQKEIEILEQIRGREGIVPYIGGEFRSGRFYLYYEYFPQGTLTTFLEKNKSPELRQTAMIFLDIAKGVRTLHRKGFVHRDLHEGNFLVDITPEKSRAALVDFGLTIQANDPDDGIVQGWFLQCPPEPLLKSISTIDRFAVDVYALGSVLHRALWGKTNPCNGVYNIYKLYKYSSSVRRNLYDRIQSLYISSKNEQIGSIIQKYEQGDSLAPLERIQLLAYQMIDVIPEKRPAIDRVIEVLEQVLAETE